METYLLPLYGALVVAVLCSAAVPWLRRLYRRRFGGPDAHAATPTGGDTGPRSDLDAGPFATPRQVCIAGTVLAAVVLLSHTPVLTTRGGQWARSLRLLDLGLMPFLSANSLVAMVAILVPWLRCRATSPRMPDRDCLTVYALTVGLALYRAIVVSGYEEQMLVDGMGPSLTAWLPAWAWLFAGGLLCLGLALLVNRVCGGHGFSVVLLATAIAASGTGLAAALRALRDQAGGPGVRAGAFLLPIVPSVLFGLTAAGLLGERAAVLRQREGQGTVRLPVPVALTGWEPLFFASALIHAPLALPWVRQSAFREHFAYGAPAFLALQAVAVALPMYVYALILLPPGGFRDRLAQFGLVPMAVCRGQEPQRVSFSRVLWSAQWPWLVVLLASAWSPHMLMHGLGVPSALAHGAGYLAAPVAALAVALLVQYHVRRRGWQPVFRHREMCEILVVRALLAERGIAAEITWRESYGALAGLFIGPLATKLLYVPPELSVEAAGIVEEYQFTPPLQPGADPRPP